MIDCIQPSNPFPFLSKSASAVKSADDSSVAPGSFSQLLKAQETDQSSSDSANGSSAASASNSNQDRQLNNNSSGSSASTAGSAASPAAESAKNTSNQSVNQVPSTAGGAPAKNVSRAVDKSKTVKSGPAAKSVQQNTQVATVNTDLPPVNIPLAAGQNLVNPAPVQLDAQLSSENNSNENTAVQQNQSVLSAFAQSGFPGSQPASTTLVNKNGLQTTGTSLVDANSSNLAGALPALDPKISGAVQTSQSAVTGSTAAQAAPASFAGNNPLTSAAAASASQMAVPAQLIGMAQTQPVTPVTASKAGGEPTKIQSDIDSISSNSGQLSASQLVLGQTAGPSAVQQAGGAAQANLAGLKSVETGSAAASAQKAQVSANPPSGNSVSPAAQQVSVAADPSTNKAQAAQLQPSNQADKLAQTAPSSAGSKTEDNAVKGQSIKLSADKAQSVSLETVQAAPTVIKETDLGQPVVKEIAAQPDSQPSDVVQQIVRQMNGSIQNGQSTMKVQLHPQDLGSIEIQLVNSGHGISVTVSAEQASTGKMLQGQADQLRQALQDSGIQLSSLNINQHGQSSQHGSASNQQSQNAYPNGRGVLQSDLESKTSQEPLTGKINSGNQIEYLI